MHCDAHCETSREEDPILCTSILMSCLVPWIAPNQIARNHQHLHERDEENVARARSRQADMWVPNVGVPSDDQREARGIMDVSGCDHEIKPETRSYVLEQPSMRRTERIDTPRPVECSPSDARMSCVVCWCKGCFCLRLCGSQLLSCSHLVHAVKQSNKKVCALTDFRAAPSLLIVEPRQSNKYRNRPQLEAASTNPKPTQKKCPISLSPCLWSQQFVTTFALPRGLLLHVDLFFLYRSISCSLAFHNSNVCIGIQDATKERERERAEEENLGRRGNCAQDINDVERGLTTEEDRIGNGGAGRHADERVNKSAPSSALFAAKMGTNYNAITRTEQERPVPVSEKKGRSKVIEQLHR